MSSLEIYGYDYKFGTADDDSVNIDDYSEFNYDSSSIDSDDSATVTALLGPYPLRIYISVMVAVGMAVNVVSMACDANGGRLSSAPFFDAALKIMGATHFVALVSYGLAIAVSEFADAHSKMLLPNICNYLVPIRNGLVTASNYTFVLVCLERMINACQGFVRIGRWGSFMLFLAETLVLLGVVFFYMAPQAFMAYKRYQGKSAFPGPPFSVIYSHLTVSAFSFVVPLIAAALLLAVGARAANAGKWRNRRHDFPQELRQAAATRWMWLFWALASVPNLGLFCLELMWKNEWLLKEKDLLGTYDAVKSVAVPAVNTALATYLACVMVLKFLC